MVWSGANHHYLGLKTMSQPPWSCVEASKGLDTSSCRHLQQLFLTKKKRDTIECDF